MASYGTRVTAPFDSDDEGAAEVMPDPAPGYEWYRELADD